MQTPHSVLTGLTLGQNEEEVSWGEGNTTSFSALGHGHIQPLHVRKAPFKRYRERKKNAVNRDSKGKMIQEEWKDLKGKILTIHE